MLTKFGRAVRQHRMDREMLMKDMAQRLGVSPAYLSSIESGRKPVPPGFADRIASMLHLNDAARRELNESANASLGTSFTISLPATSGANERELGALLARNFGRLSEADMVTIKNIINKKGG